MIRKILVATHGTEGARKAEAYAISLAKTFNAELHGLYVINKGWGSLVGIEWLHSADVRMDFYRYAESQFYQRAEDVLGAFSSHAEGIKTTSCVKVGEPAEVIAEQAKEGQMDIIIIGPESVKRSEEYKAKISLKKLLKLSQCPVLIVSEMSRNDEGGGDKHLGCVKSLCRK